MLCRPAPPPLLQAAWQLLQNAASWQAAEAALYLFSTVSLAVKTRVLAQANGGDENAAAGSASAAVAEDRAQTHALLLALFGRVCSPEGSASMLGAHPMLAEAACRLVEHYAAWFGQAGEEPPLQGALQLLLRALAVTQVGGSRVVGVQTPLLQLGRHQLAGRALLGMHSSSALPCQAAWQLHHPQLPTPNPCARRPAKPRRRASSSSACAAPARFATLARLAGSWRLRTAHCSRRARRCPLLSGS